MRTSENESIRIMYVIILTFVLLAVIITPLMNLPHCSAVTWDPIEEISGDKRTEYQRYPAIVAESGITYVVWSDNDGKDYNIVFREHDGNAWQAEEELNPSDMNIDQWNPDVAVDGGIIHAVWHDSVNGDWDIMYRKRSSGVWGGIEEVSVDVSVETQMYPRVAASGGNVYVVWQDGRDGDWDIYFRFHNGVSWSGVTQVNSDSGTEAQTYPRIAAGGGKAYVVWVDGGGGDKDIMMRVFDGSIWDSEIEVSEDSMGEEQDEPDVTYDGGVVHLTWQEFETTDRDIFYRNWNGMSFSLVTEVSIDSGTEFQKVPAIDAQFGIVHFVWADRGDGDWDIVYRQYNGSSWLSPQEISADIGTEDQYLPDIAIDNGVIHVVWADPGDGDHDIFYRRGNETAPEDIFPPEIQSVLLDGLNTLWIPHKTPSVTLTATVDDSATGGSIIGGANYTWGYQMWMTSTSMTPDDVLDSSTEGFHSTLDTSSLGIGSYEIFVYGWDEVPNRNLVGTHATLIVIPEIYLEEGWNLVSFPQIVSNSDLRDVLASIDGDYDAVQYYNLSDTNDPWKHFQTTKPLNSNDFYDVDNKMGFWIHVTKPGGTTITINGTIPANPQNITLYPGWNHVGYPSLTERDRTTALNNLTFDSEVDAIWTHNSTTKLWKEVGEFDKIEYGRGYWIHATTQCEWIINI
jgi:hypothetical protein